MCYENKVEEEANVQAEAQRYKGEGEVHINLTPEETTGAESRKAQRPWSVVPFFWMARLLPRTGLNGSGTSVVILISSATVRPTWHISKWPLWVFCSGPVTFWTSSGVICG